MSQQDGLPLQSARAEQYASPPTSEEEDGRTQRVERKFRPDVEGLRALAVLLVVL
jgi:hypothetical protein